ncbi:MAG: putative O-glycosylation ligase, exosortase A system-associated [Desulfobacula sp.]|nr:putative O-glycosylation ligase, exosortase A system-associated [Desulfobacula sp.]
MIRDIILASILLIAFPSVLLRPYNGIYVWSWLAYMNPHRLTWGAFNSAPLSLITVVLTIAAIPFYKGKKQVILNLTTVIWVLFILWMCFTTYLALNPVDSVVDLQRTLKIQFMTVITIFLITDMKKVNRLVWVICLSLGFFAVKGGLFTLRTGGQWMVTGPPHSFISGNTEIGLAMVMALPLINYLRLISVNRWINYGLMLALILSFFAIIGTHSRGAFLAGGAIVVFLWLKSNRKILYGFILAIILFISLSFMPEQYFDKMKTIETYEEDASAMGRLNAWQFALNLTKERPFVGGGFQVFTPYLFTQYAPNPTDYHDAHSIYFEVLGEQGYVGLLLFLTLGFLTWRNIRWINRYTKNITTLYWANQLIKMIEISFVGYAVGGAFLGLAYWDLPYQLMAIVLIVKEIVKKDLLAMQQNG